MMREYLRAVASLHATTNGGQQQIYWDNGKKWKLETIGIIGIIGIIWGYLGIIG